ncbi:MAG TPA: hypothetical protein VJK71_06135 [Gemmatimonadales bacterium]|nr:hypothetical protein [Gemmatimonadales bacterium]
MRASRTGLLALALAACGSTDPSGRLPLHGRFGAPFADRTAYLALSLFGDATVSGRAWSNYNPSLIAGATITGRYDPPMVTLDIHPDIHFGVLDWRLVGTLERDTLKGVLTFAGTNAQRVELPRVKAIPLGDYSQRISGAVQDTSTGWATFNYGGGSFRLIQVFSVQDQSFTSMVVFWNRRDRPPRGVYELSEEGGPPPSVRFVFRAVGGQDVRYTLREGKLLINESERYVLAGQYRMTATDPEGRVVTVRGTFNSGCASPTC